MKNSIPFENMSLKEANKRPYSPYAQMSLALKGYIVLELATDRIIQKFELFERFSHSPDQLEKIKARRYPGFLFINKDDYNI